MEEVSTATTKEAIIKKVAAESPALAERISSITADDFLKWVNAVVALLGLLIAAYTAVVSNCADEANQRFIEHLTQELEQTKKMVVSPQVPSQYKKTLSRETKQGRNELCLCGSRKKHKKCCGLYQKPTVHHE